MGVPRGILAGLCFAVLAGGAAMAQGTDRDARIKGAMKVALENIQHARCTDTAFCEPATPAELQTPPLTVAEGGTILGRGTISGVAKACGLDWQAENFAPLMASFRGNGKSDRQMALVAILHGMAQAQAEAKMRATPCDDTMRANVRAKLSFQP